jgi:hypothetical protein
MGLALGGVVVGIPAALVLTRLMRGLLSEVTTTDLLTYVAVVVMLGLAAFLASTCRPAGCAAGGLSSLAAESMLAINVAGEAGEPTFRELEPHWRMAQAARATAKGGLTGRMLLTRPHS